jgi:hypothetical protein
VRDLGHRAERRRGDGQRGHRGAIRHVYLLSRDGVPLPAQGVSDPLEDLRVEVRQHDMATRALTSGDRLAHAADPDHDNDVVDHVRPPVCTSHTHWL